MAVAEGHLYVARRSSLGIMDVSNPAAPRIVSSITVPAGAIALDGSYAYVGGAGGFSVVDVSNRLAPAVVGKTRRGSDGSICDVAVAGDLACVAMYEDGLAMVDISTPERPRIVGHLVTPAPARYITLAHNHAYVSTNERHLLVIDVSKPAAPVLAGDIPTQGWAKDVAVAGRYAYCIIGDRLDVLDLWQPASPEMIASVDMVSAASVAVHGNRAYVLPDTFILGLRVLDISNPAAPRPAGGVNNLSRHARATTDGDLVCTASPQYSRIEAFPAQCGEPAPELGLRVSQNPYLTQNLDLHLTGSAPLDPTTVRMRVGTVETPLTRADPGGTRWTGRHELTADSVSAALFACASSTEGASAGAETRFSARRLRRGRAGVVTSPDGRLTISLHEPGLAADGYIVVMPGDASGDPADWEVSPRGLLNGATATLEISYSDAEVPDPASLHIEELNAGPLESIVDPVRHVVTTTINELGTFRLVAGQRKAVRRTIERS